MSITPKPKLTLANASSLADGATNELSVRRVLDGKSLLIVGGTGFLGKVWWAMLLDLYPTIQRIVLVVRPKAGMSAEERFWSELATNPVLNPLRETHGENFEAFLREKITVVPGDVTESFCGIPEDFLDSFRGKIDCVANASGIVNFDPPLDVALEVNAFGVRNIVELAKRLGDLPVLHTSTCFVAGRRCGQVEEIDPRAYPFPRANELEISLWDADREIAECIDVIEQVRHRAGDAFRQSHFLDLAKQQLREQCEPESGATLDEQVERVKRQYVEKQLAQLGTERANFWGWVNTYTYTKSIGEQQIANSGLPFTIVRPAIIESSLSFPCKGWNEGVNTSAPIIYAIREGQLQVPGSHHHLDIIPCDTVAVGMILALAELLEGRAQPIYQLACSDVNPVSMARIYELSGLYKRQYIREKRKTFSTKSSTVEGSLMSSANFKKWGAKPLARLLSTAAEALDRTDVYNLTPFTRKAKKSLRKTAAIQFKIGGMLEQFSPFTAELDYTFRCDNARSAYQRLSEEEKEQLPWVPESIDWHDWFFSVHVPALETWVFPELEQRISRVRPPARSYETLADLQKELCERHINRTFIEFYDAANLWQLSYGEFRQLSLGIAERWHRSIAKEDITSKARHTMLLLASQNPAFYASVAACVEIGFDCWIVSELPSLKELREYRNHGDMRIHFQPLSDAEALLVSSINSELRTQPVLLNHSLFNDVSRNDSSSFFQSQKTGQVSSFVFGTDAALKLNSANFCSASQRSRKELHVEQKDTILSVDPVSEAQALLLAFYVPMSVGARLAFTPDFGDLRALAALTKPRYVLSKSSELLALKDTESLAPGKNAARAVILQRLPLPDKWRARLHQFSFHKNCGGQL